MIEIWKSLNSIVECGKYYEVSNLGNVKSIDRNRYLKHLNSNQILKGKELKKSISNVGKGYFCANLYEDGEKKRHSFHRLVAIAFIPNPENKPQVNHIDGNTKNNRTDNLEWVTNKENHIHAIEIGLQTPSEYTSGEKNGGSKLKESDVLGIREMYSSGKYLQKDIASIFNVSTSLISNIIKRIAWKHI